MNDNKYEPVGRIAIYCGSLSGFIALSVAVAALIGGRWEAAALCFVGAAIAFGLLANATLRR